MTTGERSTRDKIIFATLECIEQEGMKAVTIRIPENQKLFVDKLVNELF